MFFGAVSSKTIQIPTMKGIINNYNAWLWQSLSSCLYLVVGIYMLLHIVYLQNFLLYLFAYNFCIFVQSYVNAYKMKSLATFVKEKRKSAGLTQEQLSERSGIALTVIRKIEQGKESLNLSSVNQVLLMFGSKLGPMSTKDIEKDTL